MLDDRLYMRRPAFGPPRPATIFLLIISAVASGLQFLIYRFTRFPLDDYFALSVEGLRHGYVWQLLTFQFMHGGVLHLLLHCWSIYIFGRAVEKAPGQRRLPTLYFSSGIICGPFHALAEVLLPSAIRGTVVG